MFHAQMWQFWKLAHISETTARIAKINSISIPWGKKREYVQLLEIWPLATFPAQMCQFWKSGHISETAAHRVKISSILASYGRKIAYMQILELWLLAKLQAQIWQFWKLAHISETAARRAKISLISTTWSRRECMCHFWNFEQWPSFMAKYGNFENQPLSQKLLPNMLNWVTKKVYVQLLELCPMAKLVLKQSVKAHGPRVRFH